MGVNTGAAEYFGRKRAVWRDLTLTMGIVAASLSRGMP
jgi:hypothetical protein